VGAGAVPVLAAVAVTLFAAPVPNWPAAPARGVAQVRVSHRITGKLDKDGYTVIAVAANGTATTAYAKRGRFTLRPPAKRVTLHLRAPDGRYAGPVVLRAAKPGKRVIVGVRQGASLGRITVRSKLGYARVVSRPRRAVVAAQWWAR